MVKNKYYFVEVKDGNNSDEGYTRTWVDFINNIKICLSKTYMMEIYWEVDFTRPDGKTIMADKSFKNKSSAIKWLKSHYLGD